MPQNVLIADRNNSRIISISPKGQVVWTHAVSAPSDAYLSYTGHTAVITQHTQSRIFTLEVDPSIVNYIYVATRTKRASADNFLRDPQTAPGDTAAATNRDRGPRQLPDPCSCGRPTHAPVRTTRRQARPTACITCSPEPYTFSKPDAAFPAANGDLVVTELSPAWVDVFDKSLKLLDQIKLSEAGFTAPYDANEYAPGDLIVVDRTTPGVVEGSPPAAHAAMWRYDVTSGDG